MDFRIHQSRAELESTGFMEIGPGQYDGQHWRPGFVFMSEDAFGFAEGILARHVPGYDHFGMNDIPRVIGRRVIDDWRAAAAALPSLSMAEVSSTLNLEASFREYLDAVVSAQRAEIAGALAGLADALDLCYAQDEWACILGM